MATVFVPINAAWEALAQQTNSTVAVLLAQTDMLAQASRALCVLTMTPWRPQHMWTMMLVAEEPDWKSLLLRIPIGCQYN